MLFSYTSQFNLREKSEKVTVSNIFYINPNNVSEYVIRDVQDVQLTDEKISLFSRENEKLGEMSAADKYRRLVELTNEIIANTGKRKKTVSEYADIISGFVGKELESYYLALGYDYFLWLNSLI